MYRSDKNDLRFESICRKFLIRLRMGLQILWFNHLFLFGSIVYWYVIIKILCGYESTNFFTKLLLPVAFMFVIICASILFLATLIIMGTPKRAVQMEQNFQRIGLTNRAGEPPIVVKIERCGDNHREAIELDSRGIPIDTYKDNLGVIESALNKRIVDMIDGKDCKTIMMYVVPGNIKIPQKIDWANKFLPLCESVVALGENLNGQVVADLNITPHLLIGGSTGSGKTVLIKTLIYQALEKSMDVYLLDMKGGLDYPSKWKNNQCSFCDDAQDALSVLSSLVQELNRRKGLFGQLDCANIEKYNKQSHEADKMRRIVIVLDEIAELTDTTGLDKPHKELAQRTIAQLSTLARMGRAYGIHLIIGTQRPDANVIPGQIKNNCDIRICGRADNTLSMIILDSADAADRINKNKQGRFLMQDGTEFQGYWLDI